MSLLGRRSLRGAIAALALVIASIATPHSAATASADIWAWELTLTTVSAPVEFGQDATVYVTLRHSEYASNPSADGNTDTFRLSLSARNTETGRSESFVLIGQALTVGVPHPLVIPARLLTGADMTVQVTFSHVTNVYRATNAVPLTISPLTASITMDDIEVAPGGAFGTPTALFASISPGVQGVPVVFSRSRDGHATEEIAHATTNAGGRASATFMPTTAPGLWTYFATIPTTSVTTAARSNDVTVVPRDWQVTTSTTAGTGSSPTMTVTLGQQTPAFVEGSRATLVRNGTVVADAPITRGPDGLGAELPVPSEAEPTTAHYTVRHVPNQQPITYLLPDLHVTIDWIWARAIQNVQHDPASATVATPVQVSARIVTNSGAPQSGISTTARFEHLDDGTTLDIPQISDTTGVVRFPGELFTAGLWRMTLSAPHAASVTSNFEVAKLESRTSLSVTAETSDGTPLRLRAEVESEQTPPTGTVTFRTGTTLIGTATLTNGVAEFTATGLANGDHSFTATYSGDERTLPSSGSTTAWYGSKPTAAALPTTGASLTSTVLLLALAIALLVGGLFARSRAAT